MLIERRYLIRGLVQGVGFRLHTKDAALREGVVGFVRNLRNGQVEVGAKGESEAVNRFEQALRQGPTGAKVDGVDIETFSLIDEIIGFEIRG